MILHFILLKLILHSLHLATFDLALHPDKVDLALHPATFDLALHPDKVDLALHPATFPVFMHPTTSAASAFCI